MKQAHLIMTPFTGVGLHGGYRGDAWLAHRIEIFKNHTLKSFLNQSNKDFLHWFSFRPEEQNNSLVLGLAEHLKDLNYPFVFTFYGLPYWDDKFTFYTLRTRLRNAIMMLRDAWLYKEWPRNVLKNAWENKNKTLIQRIEASLVGIKDAIGDEYDWVYLTRIDSDDMFHREAVELIQSQEPAYKKALIFEKGYIYNVLTGQLADWNPPTNPPFHTIIFPGNIFFNPQLHQEYYGTFKTHEDIPKVFDATMLDMGRFCVAFHGKHINTAWDSSLARKAHYKLKYGVTEPFRGEEYEPKGYCYTTSGKNISTHWESQRGVKNYMIGQEQENKKAEILKDFGIYVSCR